MPRMTHPLKSIFIGKSIGVGCRFSSGLSCWLFNSSGLTETRCQLVCLVVRRRKFVGLIEL